jgi:FkbM family methyltransferase
MWAPAVRVCIAPAVNYAHAAAEGEAQRRLSERQRRREAREQPRVSTTTPAKAVGSVVQQLRKVATPVLDASSREFESMSEMERLKFLVRNADLIPESFWYRTQERRVLRAPLDYPSATILMRTGNKREHVRLRACAKEPWTVEWIEQLIHPGDVLYDIGANVGAYSLIAAMKPGGGARVVAFEPGCSTFASLCENVSINGLSECVTPLPVALSDVTDLGFFNYTSLSAGSALHALETTKAVIEFQPVFRQPLLTFRLDDLIPQFRLPQPNHLKIDVDGAEVAVLQGASETLENPALRTVMVEVLLEQSSDVTQWLEQKGLKLTRRIERPNKEGVLMVWYGLFARDDSNGVA